jgi:subtilisin family serine protease
MKTYNVILHKGVNYQSFWDDMENENDGGKLYIPNRRVDSPNLRPNSQRQTWYTLSDEEATIVRNDERVLAVEIPPEFRDDIIIAPRITQEGTFTKTTSDSGAFINWGLIRSNSKTNNYGSGTTTSESYLYTLDGTNVDVVIQDSGLQSDHPEFTDSNNLSRVVDIDWFDESGVSGTQSSNHNRDNDGHGTHCGGIAVGKTYGWAKNANIYSQKIAGLEGTGDSGTGISPSVAFDCIKGWHANKGINVDTGVKNPTIVNMSWGYLTTLTNGTITNLNYRGTDYTGTDIDSTTEREQNYGLMYSLYSSEVYAANLRIASVDTDIEELLEAGVHVCVAAGNRSNKIDEVGGDDYDNNYTDDGDTNYYHRGSSPYGDAGNDGSPRAIIVGNMDSNVASATNDQKATSSETGPGVDIYAPGTNIMSATSTTNKWGGGSQNYYLNSSFKQTNISGTSMASPQVAGVLALYLQVNPTVTPAQAKEWLLSNAGTAILNTGTGNDWTNDRSLKDGAAKVLFNKFNKTEPIKIQNVSSNFITNGLTLTTK